MASGCDACALLNRDWSNTPKMTIAAASTLASAISPPLFLESLLTILSSHPKHIEAPRRHLGRQIAGGRLSRAFLRRLRSSLIRPNSFCRAPRECLTWASRSQRGFASRLAAVRAKVDAEPPGWRSAGLAAAGLG